MIIAIYEQDGEDLAGNESITLEVPYTLLCLSIMYYSDLFNSVRFMDKII